MNRAKNRHTDERSGAAAVLVAVIASLLLFTLFAPEAHARSFVIEPCASGGPASTEQSYVWSGPSYSNNRWTMETSCPSTAVLRAAPYRPGQLINSYWTYPYFGRPDSQLVGMRFALAGSDGSEASMTQGIRACNSSNNSCGPLIKPSGSSVNAPELHNLVFGSGSIPVGADMVRAEGWCNLPFATGCQAARPLEIKNLELEYADDDLPTVELAQTQGNVDGAKPLRLDDWNSGPRFLRLHGRDGTSGVLFASVKVGPVRRDIDTFGCGDSYSASIPWLCPKSMEFVQRLEIGPSLSFWGLHRGANPITATVFDAAGEESELFIGEFKADVVRPYLENPRLKNPHTNGWQSALSVDLEFDHDQWEETDEQSAVELIRYDVDPILGGGVDPPVATVAAETPGQLNNVSLPGFGWWRIKFWLVDGAENESEKREIYVGADDVIPAAPEIEALGTVGANELANDRTVSWQPPSNSGEIRSEICGYAVAVDQSPSTDPGANHKSYDEALVERLPSALNDGDNYVHVRAVSCAGVLGEIAHRKFNVDARAPVLAISQPGGAGWYTGQDPFLATASALDGGEIEMRASIGVAEGNWVVATELQPQLVDGVHQVTIQARDELGNVATWATTVRIDQGGPTIRVNPWDAGDPAAVAAEVVDDGSGVSGGSAAIRVAGGEWQSIGGIVSGQTSTGQTAHFSARIPDAELPPNAYELRVRLRDVVGNETTATSDLRGRPLTFSVPLRAASSISAGFRAAKVVRKCKRVRRKRVCRSTSKRSVDELVGSTVVAHGASDPIFGTLRGPDGQPLPDRPIEIFEDVLGQGRRIVGSTTTGALGEFLYTPTPGPSRRLTVRYSGSPTQLASSSELQLLVRPKLKFEISRKKVKRGSLVKFSGRIAGDGAPLPRNGVPVFLECKVDGRWRSCLLDFRTDREGRFSLGFRFAAPGPPVDYVFRVRSLAVDGWPFEVGYSTEKRLAVR